VERAEAALLDGAALADRVGVDVIWVAERPTQPGALVPAVLPLCAALLARTARIRVATGLLPLPLHHPLRVAEDAATLDGLSGGRFELGVGLGADPEGFASYGLAREQRADRFAEALDLIRRAWGPGPVAFQGRHFQLPPTLVVPKPVAPGGPPLWIGARTASLQRNAAALGAGLVLHADDSPDAYLESAPESARLAWLLPECVDPQRGMDAAQRVLARSGAAQQVDLVFPTPSELGDGRALEHTLQLVGERIAPALRSA